MKNIFDIVYEIITGWRDMLMSVSEALILTAVVITIPFWVIPYKIIKWRKSK